MENAIIRIGEVHYDVMVVYEYDSDSFTACSSGHSAQGETIEDAIKGLSNILRDE